MLEEIVPALKSTPGSKMLEASPLITAQLPQLKSRISFVPLLNFLEEKQHQVSEIKANCYRFLIKKFREQLEQAGPIDPVQTTPESAALLELLGTMLFPMVSKNEKQTFALATPYKFEVFFSSDCFRELFMGNNETELLLPENITTDELKHIECSLIYDHILDKFYGIKLNESPVLLYQRQEQTTGMKKFYKIRFDRRFTDINLKGELPAIKDCAVCMNTFRILDLEQQLQTMPLDLFETEGFALWVAEDVTDHEALDIVRKILLRQHVYDMRVIDELKDAIQILVGLNDVEIGLMPFIKVNDQFVLEDSFTRHSIVGHYWKSGDPASENEFQSYISFLHEYNEAMPVSVVDEELLSFAAHLRTPWEEGTRSYINYPLRNSDGLLGMLELSSPIPNLLNHEVITRLETIIPPISLVLVKFREQFHQKIETMIKEKFTALQQSVEWKFTEVAWQNMKYTGKNQPPARVTFEEVYPLYGAIDIRSSSQERGIAIQNDLKTHLQEVFEVMNRLQEYINFPLLDGLKFKTQELLHSMDGAFMSRDEIFINEFLNNEVMPVLAHLQKNQTAVQPVIDEYFSMINDHESKLFHHRRQYEQTLSSINNAVLQFLEEEEEKIQKAYPHYFERFRTDGIDYTIYIGQSLAPNLPFDLLYLKNLRLWQLTSMANIARLTHNMLPDMQVPLHTTQLILVHSQLLTIGFRSDERKFDVEGSYNIRYETIKKRLDKALIKNTGERLTQPGKIAIVYSSPKEQQEYGEYIQFLQNQQVLKPGIEMLELEEMQGVFGLKAMRVEVICNGKD